MDTTIAIRKRIHEFIDQADERILRIFNAIITTEEANTTVPDSHYAEIDKRREKYLSGNSQIFTIEEAKNRARAAKK